MRSLRVRLLPQLAATAALLLVAACSKDETTRRAPPPPAPAASAKADVCASGGGTLADADAARVFPRVVGGFCLDPNGKGDSFGDGAPQPIDKICDIFDGECEIYRGFNVRRVTEIRYVDGKGSPATIDIHLSKFGTSESAYAMFTKRVVGDGDPADDATPRPIAGGGAAALGLGNAYVWRGVYLAEITYNDETVKEEAALKTASTKLLPPLVKEVGDALPGEPTLPAAAAALPKDDLLPLGVRFETKDALGVGGLGAGAFGYYKAGDKRWRVLSLVRGDVDQAKDVIATLAKLPGATKEKGVAEQAVRFMHEDEDKVPVEWIVARVGKTVLGLGDEVRVLRAGMTADDHAKVTLAKDEKIARLRKALGL